MKSRNGRAKRARALARRDSPSTIPSADSTRPVVVNRGWRHGARERAAWRRLLTGRRDAARECADVAEQGNCRVARIRASTYPACTRVPRVHTHAMYACKSAALSMHMVGPLRAIPGAPTMTTTRIPEESAGRVYDWPGTARRMNCGQWMSLLSGREPYSNAGRACTAARWKGI